MPDPLLPFNYARLQHAAVPSRHGQRGALHGRPGAGIALQRAGGPLLVGHHAPAVPGHVHAPRRIAGMEALMHATYCMVKVHQLTQHVNPSQGLCPPAYDFRDGLWLQEEEAGAGAGL